MGAFLNASSVHDQAKKENEAAAERSDPQPM